MPELVYAALLYKDGNSPESPSHKDFVQGTTTENAGETKLNFSFQKPDDTNGTFTLEIFAFEKTSDDEEGTADFSKDKALLSGKKDGLSISGDTIEIDGTIALAISSTEHGTVSLKIKVPEGCSLEIKELKSDGTAESNARFIVTGDSPDFTVTQKDESGISAGAYQVKFTVKKKVGESEEIVHIFSEYINVINGFCTDTWWNGAESSATKEITQSMISSTVYVRGTGGWYDGSDYKDSVMADDNNTGSFLSPLASIQKAVDTVIARNDGASAYTIYVDGTLAQDTAASVEGMADFYKLSQNLTLTIKALSGTATLDANKLSRVINAKPDDANLALNLTLENLTLTGGNTSESGGGIYFGSAGGTLTISDGTTIKVNTASGNGGNVYVENGTFEMEGGTISGGNATQGGGVYVTGTESTFTMNGGSISNCKATQSGGGVVVDSSATFEMSGTAEITRCKITSAASSTGGGGIYNAGTLTVICGTISDCTAGNGGGVYNNGTLTVESGTTISGCVSDSHGGGIYNKGTAEISGCAIESCEAKHSGNVGGGGGIYSKETLTVTGGSIKNCKAEKSYGGGLLLYGSSNKVSHCTVTGVTISDCKSSYGGGVSVFYANFTMKDGTTISGNTESLYGGGVYIGITSTFEMAGGTISNNKATYGGGVYYSAGSFMMSGNAKVESDNDVKLYSDSKICITDTLAASSPVVTITPSAYTANRLLLSAGDGVTLDGSICNKFAVKPQADGTEWRVALDGADGVLIRKYEMGDTGPGGGAVCYYDADALP